MTTIASNISNVGTWDALRLFMMSSGSIRVTPLLSALPVLDGSDAESVISTAPIFEVVFSASC